jgi:hypothetical protein
MKISLKSWTNRSVFCQSPLDLLGIAFESCPAWALTNGGALGRSGRVVHAPRPGSEVVIRDSLAGAAPADSLVDDAASGDIFALP